MRIEVFSDVGCPWCYIGKRRFERALAQFPHRDQVEVEWKSYQLDPSLPEHDPRSEVEYLTQAKGLPEDQVHQMLAHVASQALTENLHYDFDSLVVANSWKAHRVIQRAKAVSLEAAAELEEQLFSAHFERGQDIGAEDVLVALGQAAGLTADQVREALTDSAWEDRVRSELQEARTLGVTGVPFFVLDRTYGISGAQPTGLFAQALERAWAEHQPLQMVSPAAEASGSGASGGLPDDGTQAGLDGQVCGPEGCD